MSRILRTPLHLFSLLLFAAGCSQLVDPAANVPSSPTGVAAVAGDQLATVTWIAPSLPGSSPITGYTITSVPETKAVTVGDVLTGTVSGLTDGVAYTFTVHANNAEGVGLESLPSAPVIPLAPLATVPGAPTDVAATSADGQATVTWTAPSSAGSSPVTGYTITTTPGGAAMSVGNVLTGTVTGLSDGVAYTFTVQAVNANGAGPASAPSAPVIPLAAPMVVPSAPMDVVASAGDGQATVTWVAPESMGSSAITGYTITSTPGGNTMTVGVVLTGAVTGLTDGVAYTFTVQAINATGPGAASLPSVPVIPLAAPMIVPGAPTNVVATAGSGEASVSWAAPGSAGSSAITGYTITSTPGALTATVANVLTGTVTGLTDGIAYTFTVQAINATGAGAASAPSAPVTPLGPPMAVPGAPTDVVATPGNGEATITWAVPENDGGNAIESYLVTASPGGAQMTVVGVLTTTISGLTNGTSYVFVVSATNGVGPGPDSLPSSPTVPSTDPEAPIGVTATAGDGDVLLTWTAPDNGGNSISGYIVATTPQGGLSTTSQWPFTTALITGLTDGTSYSFAIAAVNAVGTSNASSSVTATPTRAPDAPVSATAVAGNGEATVTWAAPVNEGGTAVTGYTVTAIPGGATMPATASPATVTGLSNGTSYSFTVQATNATGTSAPSAPSNAVTPAAVPGQPTSLVATYGNQQVSLTWSGPASNGGSPILSYTVTTTPTGGAATTTTSLGISAIVTGLANGTSCTFSVAATNVMGTGPASTTATATPSTVPGAPTITGTTAGNTQVTVSWTAPASTGGSPITGYTVVTSPGGGTTPTTLTSIAVASLTNGSPYTFTVYATNANGNSVLSIPSAPVTPAATPAAPTGVTLTAGNAQIALSWVPPTNSGGSPITGYVVKSTPSGGATATTPVTGNFTTLTSLTNGTSYSITVAATNALGTGTASTAATATPATVPGAPAITSVVPASTQVAVTWTAPISNGGSAVTGYTVTAEPGGATMTTTGALTATVTGLANFSSYSFVVSATNVMGTGPVSVASATVIPTGTASSSKSTLTVSAPKPNADGISTTTLTATIRDSSGNPLPGQPVRLTATGSANVLMPESGSTNAAGVFTATLSSIHAEAKAIQAISGTTTLSAAVSFSVDACASSSAFINEETYTTGTHPYGVATADFNLDGKLDVAFAVNGASVVTVMLGVGDGTFLPGVNYTLPGAANAIGSADFNRDGKPDLALYADSGLVVLLGNGDGTFQTAAAYAAGQVPGGTALAVGDFNEDGYPDVAIANVNGVAGFFGSASGTFTLASPSNPSEGFTGYNNLNGVTAADYNNDGKLDLAFTDSFTAQVHVVFGTGTGTFGGRTAFPPAPSPLPGPPTSLPSATQAGIASADFNQDGNQDIAVVNRDSSTPSVSILLGLGDGGFESTVNGYGNDPAALSVTLGDVNGDGKPDVLVTGAYEGVGIMLGNGDGTFQAETHPLTNTTFSQSVALGDFNGDGRMDFAATDYNNAVLDVMFGSWKSSFKAATTTALPGAGQAVTAGDFNGDGILDAVTANPGTGNVSLLLGQASGVFKTAANTTVAGAPQAIVSADFNLDGKLDIATANNTGGNVAILLGNGTGTFQTPLTDTVGAAPVAVATADFNNDGLPDLVTANSTSNNISVLLGTGGGAFATQVPYPVGNDAQAVVALDYNHDGIPDLIVANATDGTISLLPGKGDGTFPTSSIRTVANPVAMTTGDFNGDGIIDLAVASASGPYVTVFLGSSGSPYLTAVAATAAVGAGVTSITSGDYNGDGWLDVATGDATGAIVSVLFGNDNGTFAAQVTFSAGAGATPAGIASGDFNGDGRLDLLVANGGANDVSLLIDECLP